MGTTHLLLGHIGELIEKLRYDVLSDTEAALQ